MFQPLPDFNQGSVSPFFIIGSPRSGTSMLRKMINGHPALAIPDASHFYTTFYPLRELYYPLGVEKNVAALVSDALKSFHIRYWLPAISTDDVLACVTEYSFSGVFEALMWAWVKTQGKKYWGEETPQHVYFWNEILLDFPQAKFLHVVRDGRDVALSYRKAQFGPKGFAAAAYRWNHELNIVRELRSVLAGNRLLEIRYEDLLSNTGPVLERVCRFLGVDSHPAMLAINDGGFAGHTTKTVSGYTGAEIFRHNSTKWQREARQREIDIYESIAADNLHYYGYRLYSCSRDLSGFEQKVYYYLHDIPCKIISLLSNIDGIECELTRKLIALRRSRWKYLPSVAEAVLRGGRPVSVSK